MSSTHKSSNNSAGDSLNIHWFRQSDLRLHDNPSLCRTVELASSGKVAKQPVGSSAPSSTKSNGILPVFIFDTSRIYGSDIHSDLGGQKCGPRRAQFALEAVEDLRSNLQKVSEEEVVHSNLGMHKMFLSQTTSLTVYHINIFHLEW